MKKNPHWYGLDMIPVYLELSRDQLQGTMEQLQNLEACTGKAHVLNDSMVNRIIKVQSEQNESTWVLLEQCSKWRQQQLSKQQLDDVTEIENNVSNLNKTNERVLALARYFKNRTINRILEKDDIELVFDLFKG